MELKVFHVNLSKGIIGLYWGILAFVVIIFSIILFALGQNERTAQLIVSAVLVLEIILFVYIIIRAQNMRFEIDGQELTIHGVFKTHIIRKEEIVTVQKSPIPFGFRLFGASLLGGYYYLPGIGFAWVAMGNFRDGVLISTVNKKNFVITPEKPEEFIRSVQS